MLDELKPRPGARQKSKRVGRGPGSGKGRYCGRGVKGQGTRSAGRATPAGFEGGQMPLARRLPKRGFHNPFRKEVETVNVSALAALGEGATVDAETLKARGLIRGSGAPIKILGDGECPGNLQVKVHRVSEGARTKIESAGGRVELVESGK